MNDDNQTEVARYDLTEDASTETAMLFGELYRHNGEWKFRAVGRGLCWWTGFRVRSVRHQRVLIKSNFSYPNHSGVMPPISTTRYLRLAGAKNGCFSR